MYCISFHLNAVLFNYLLHAVLPTSEKIIGSAFSVTIGMQYYDSNFSLTDCLIVLFNFQYTILRKLILERMKPFYNPNKFYIIVLLKCI